MVKFFVIRGVHTFSVKVRNIQVAVCDSWAVYAGCETYIRYNICELCKYGRSDLKGLVHGIDFNKFDEKGYDLGLKKGQGRFLNFFRKVEIKFKSIFTL
jgi:hypothetical protein